LARPGRRRVAARQGDRILPRQRVCQSVPARFWM